MAGSIPSWGACKRQPVGVSHINVSPPLAFPPFSSLYKINNYFSKKENRMGLLKTQKNRSAMGASTATSEDTLRRVESRVWKRELHTPVPSGTIHNGPETQATRVSGKGKRKAAGTSDGAL